MMIHEVMVVDDAGGYYINFSEVIRFDFTWWSCSFWVLVLHVELHLGITEMILDEANRIQDDVLSTPSRQEWIILHVCISLYQKLISCSCVSWSVSVAPMWFSECFLYVNYCKFG